MATVSAICTFWNNPYLAVYFKRLYESYWKDEVDELLVCVHGSDKKVNHFIADLFPNSRITAIPLPEMGAALDYIYPFVKGDILMTIDSDNFITKKGVVKKHIELMGGEDCIHRFEAIGTAGKSSRPLWIGDEVAKHFGLVRLNSFLSFWDKKRLDEAPFTFQRMKFKKGENLFDFTFPDWCSLDTMGYMTLQFMQRGNKIIQLGRDTIDGSQHIGGLSHEPLGNNRIEIMEKIKKETINEVPKDIR